MNHIWLLSRGSGITLTVSPFTNGKSFLKVGSHTSPKHTLSWRGAQPLRWGVSPKKIIGSLCFPAFLIKLFALLLRFLLVHCFGSSPGPWLHAQSHRNTKHKKFSNSTELKGGSLPLSNSLGVPCVTNCLLSFFMMTVTVLLCN